MRRPRLSHSAAIAGLAVGAAVLVAALLAGCGGDSSGGEDAAADPAVEPGERPRLGSAHGVVNATYTFLIPEDAKTMMATGEVVNILPGSLTARVGESIAGQPLDRRD